MFELTITEKALIVAYTHKHFPGLVLYPDTTFEDIPLLDKKNALPYYNRKIVLTEKAYSSTGTSGNPKKINWSNIEDQWYIGEKRDLIIPFLTDCKKVFISLGVGHGAGTSPLVFQGSHLGCIRASLEPVSEQIVLLHKFQADVLYCSPSILTSLIKNGKKMNQPLVGIKKVVLNGEIVYNGMLDFFCAELQICREDILDTYGSTEVGTIAYSCPACNKYHFMPDIFPENMPAENIEDSLSLDAQILLLTSLKRTSFPVVRFVTYDIVRGLVRSQCKGNEYFSYDRIIGRIDDVLNYGELLPAGDLVKVIKKYYPDRDYLIFNYKNFVDIAIEGDRDVAFIRDIYAVYPTINTLIQQGVLEPYHLHFYDDLTLLRKKYAIYSKEPSHKEKNRIIKQQFKR